MRFSNSLRTLEVTLLVSCFLFSWTIGCNGQDVVSPPFYTAAVFEHHGLRIDRTSDSLINIIRANLEMYSRATKVAKEKGADIIVFPEYGIFPLRSRSKMRSILETVPDPREGMWNPCTQGFNDTILFTLSCMARKYDVVVVANMGDKQPCRSHLPDDCPEDGVFLYNANVAFGRDGRILSRYRKEHLFLEPAMDIPTEPQTPIFRTDFGTFAMFVCFDSLFKPMAQIAQEPYVDAVLLPTEWMDLLPQLSAVVYWQAWATGNNISLLVANGQYPYQGSAGSGIFSGNLGALKYTYNPDGLSKLVVSRVPRNRFQSPPFPNPEASITIVTENGTLPFYEDGKDVPEYCSKTFNGDAKAYVCKQQNTSAFSLVKLTESNDSLRICNNGMCCSLEYSADLRNESYYFGLLNATHNALNKYYFTEEMCFVFRCDDPHGLGCSKFPMRSSTVFKWVEITANFTTKFVYPSAIYSGVRLAPRNQWNYHVTQLQESSYSGYIRYVPDSSSPLLTVGLYGRSYDRDPPYVR